MRVLTADTKIKLSQIKDLFKWIKDQRGVKAHEGDYNPDHTKRKQGDEWVPAEEYQGPAKKTDKTENAKSGSWEADKSKYSAEKQNAIKIIAERLDQSEEAVYKSWKPYIDSDQVIKAANNLVANNIQVNNSTKKSNKSAKKAEKKTETSKQTPLKTVESKTKVNKSTPSKAPAEKKEPALKKELTPETKISLSQIKKEPKQTKQIEEPAGSEREISEFKQKGIERLDLSKKGMPSGYGTKDAPAGDSKIESNGITYNNYSGIREIDKFLRPRAIDYYSNCGDDVIGTLNYYTADGYIDMNAAKRGETKTTPKLNYRFEVMDKAFEEAPELGVDMVTYRYTDPIEIGSALRLKDKITNLQDSAMGYFDNQISEIEKAMKKLVGKEFTNPAYVSTNVNSKPVEKAGRQFVLRIKAGKDKKGLYTSPIAPNKYAKSDVKKITTNAENEMLFNAGSRFRIDGVSVENLKHIDLGGMTKCCIVDVTLL